MTVIVLTISLPFLGGSPLCGGCGLLFFSTVSDDQHNLSSGVEVHRRGNLLLNRQEGSLALIVVRSAISNEDIFLPPTHVSRASMHFFQKRTPLAPGTRLNNLSAPAMSWSRFVPRSMFSVTSLLERHVASNLNHSLVAPELLSILRELQTERHCPDSNLHKDMVGP